MVSSAVFRQLGIIEVGEYAILWLILLIYTAGRSIRCLFFRRVLTLSTIHFSSLATNVLRPFRPFRPLLFCLCCVLGAAHAQTALPAQARNPQRVATTIADTTSAVYRFERHELASLDDKRHYRIEISIPRVPAPEAGYPVLYMLDGNAAMDTLTADDLALISRRNPPVLVAIGYDTPGRNDVVARAYDYTPPVRENGELLAGPVVRGREGGGADVFLRFITTHIKPLVRTRVAVDVDREYL